MHYRVGLDIGTASLGVAVISLDDSKQPQDLIWKHVRIFDEPLEKSPAGLKSKKAGRRAARMQRRQIDRRLGRTKRIAALASLLGITIEPSPDSGSSLLAVFVIHNHKCYEALNLLACWHLKLLAMQW